MAETEWLLPRLSAAQAQEAGEAVLVAPPRRPWFTSARGWAGMVGGVVVLGVLALTGTRRFTSTSSELSGRGVATQSHVYSSEGLASTGTGASSKAKAPNILLVYIDDQGYNDMGPQSTDLSLLTPNIDSLRKDGIWFSNYYGQQVCTPSRATLLTGLYPIHSGMNHGFIAGNDPWGLPLRFKLLPQYLSEAANYRTHMIGKWHLGHFNQEYTPLKRGFHTFYGFFSGFEGYSNHVSEFVQCDEESDCFHDLRDQWTPVISTRYNTELFNEQAVAVLEAHATVDDPFFLYFAISNMHMPLEVPDYMMDRWFDKVESIRNSERQKYAVMTAVLDEVVGNLTATLRRTGQYEDTFIIVASDNGANPMADSGGSNWPLRGLKGTLWEGGMRVNALIRSSLVPASLRGSVYGNVFHASDWLPTIVQGILGRGDLLAKAENPLDGVNHWPALVKASSAVPRDRLVYNIDYDVSTGQVSGAIRIGDIKLIVNTVLENIFPVPKGDALQVQEAADDDASALDFMFNLTADPTESQDLRSSKPELFSHMLREFSQMQETMIADAFCGAADSAAANKVDAETQFIGPWIDDPYFKCPGEEKAGDALAHYNAILYLYNLVPRSKC